MSIWEKIIEKLPPATAVILVRRRDAAILGVFTDKERARQYANEENLSLQDVRLAIATVNVPRVGLTFEEVGDAGEGAP